jgi:hypothetical protein
MYLRAGQVQALGGVRFGVRSGTLMVRNFLHPK